MRWQRTKNEIKFAVTVAFITAALISFVLVSINVGYKAGFFFFWIRSWLVATVIATFSILYIAPQVRKFTDGKKV